MDKGRNRARPHLKIRGMFRAKAAILAAIILTAVIVAYYWRKGAGTVFLPVALIASYAVWRWRRDD